MNISFQPVVPDIIKVQTEQVEAEPVNPSTLKKEKRPVFGQRPDTKSTELYFEVESQ